MNAQPSPRTEVDHTRQVHKEQLEVMSSTESEPLLRVKSVFPFTLFPNAIEVYAEKVVINYWNFFFSRTVFPVIITDLISVTANTNVLFGEVRFEITFTAHDPDPVNYLWRNDALRVRRYVTGLMAAQKRGIKLSDLSREEILEHLERLGQTTEHNRKS